VFRFTGSGKRVYADYVDEATGRMLEAVPGWQGEMRATWDKLPVPPADGFWEVIEPPAEAGAPEPPAAPPTKGKQTKNTPEVV